jgi:hypothetical protein
LILKSLHSDFASVEPALDVVEAHNNSPSPDDDDGLSLLAFAHTYNASDTHAIATQRMTVHTMLGFATDGLHISEVSQVIQVCRCGLIGMASVIQEHQGTCSSDGVMLPDANGVFHDVEDIGYGKLSEFDLYEILKRSA